MSTRTAIADGTSANLQAALDAGISDAKVPETKTGGRCVFFSTGSRACVCREVLSLFLEAPITGAKNYRDIKMMSCWGWLRVGSFTCPILSRLVAYAT